MTKTRDVMDWLKINWDKIVLLILAILMLIVLFQTCNQEGNVYIFPDSTDRRIDRDLKESHRARTPLETNPQLIQQQNFYETNNFINLPNDSIKSIESESIATEILK